MRIMNFSRKDDETRALFFFTDIGDVGRQCVSAALPGWGGWATSCFAVFIPGESTAVRELSFPIYKFPEVLDSCVRRVSRFLTDVVHVGKSIRDDVIFREIPRYNGAPRAESAKRNFNIYRTFNRPDYFRFSLKLQIEKREVRVIDWRVRHVTDQRTETESASFFFFHRDVLSKKKKFRLVVDQTFFLSLKYRSLLPRYENRLWNKRNSPSGKARKTSAFCFRFSEMTRSAGEKVHTRLTTGENYRNFIVYDIVALLRKNFTPQAK